MFRFSPAPVVPWLLAACFASLTFASAVSATTTIRADGLLDVDGEAMFPIGLIELGTYAYPDWKERIEASGANLIWDIEIAYADTAPGCAEVMQAAADGDFYLMIGSGDTWNWDDLSTPELEVDQMMYETVELEALLDCASEHPDRILGFVNRDEPVWTISRNQIGDIDKAHIHDTYDQIHDRVSGTVLGMNFAPAHLSSDLDTWKADITSYTSATDIMMFAAYPYPPGPGTCGPYNILGYPDCPMDRLVLGADIFLSELNGVSQPLWMVIQAHKNIPLKEARWEAWASVVHGATGILWAGWVWTHALGGGAVTWPVTEQVMSEVSALQPWLTGVDFPGVYCDEPDVDVRALEHNDIVIVVAISRNGFSGPATIVLPGVDRRRVPVLNEGRRVPVTAGTITDNFDGYEAHVYRYNGRLAAVGPALPVGVPVVEPEARPFALTAFPNPSPGSVRVRFDVARELTTVFNVYDAAGRHVATLGRSSWKAGIGEVHWNGRNVSGRPVTPGAYFIRGRTSDGEAATARVMIAH